MAASPSHLLVVLAVLLLCSTAIPMASSSTTTTVNVTSFGKAYTKVCDADRFAEMGLNMSAFPYCDASLPYADRVRDLIGWMTVEEKVGNLGDISHGAPRIGLPPYKWWSEALHGISSTGPTALFDDLHSKPGNHSGRATVNNATVFANVIDSAASFNETLWKSIGQAVSTEARAMYNLGKGGLTYWSPNINVDIPGHDTGSGGDPSTRPIKTSACCKHYAAYDVDDWHNHTRFKFDARVSERDMAETFLRPFEMCVRDGDASSVMCSYNRVNGIPACADARLLSGTIRGDWQLHGYIVSDCDAIRVMTDNATWLNFTGAESSAASLRAGLDLDCAESWIEEKGRPLRDFLSEYSKAAIEQGKLRESDIDSALRNQYMTLMRLGYFDNIPRYASLNETDICTDEHRSLAHDGARQGIVLLKNDGNLLPLDPEKILAVAVHGPHARAPEKVMDGDYTGPPCRYVTPRQGISKHVKISHRANTTIYLGGINLHIEREETTGRIFSYPRTKQRRSYTSPRPHRTRSSWSSCREAASTSPSRTSTPRSVPSFGLGTLAVKVATPLLMSSLEDITQCRRRVPGRTYKFYDGPEVLYPFGYGLSYTKFLYETSTDGTSVTLPATGGHCKGLSYKPSVATTPSCQAVDVAGHACTETVSFNISVINGGGRGGAHVVLVYGTAPPPEVAQAPIKQVAAFRRVFVPATSTATVPFTLNVCKAFGIVERTAYTVVPSGVSKVLVENGDSSSSVSFPVKIDFSV
ncbi:unnamed protein product [Miscanthus lutarioriparius]|uniref:Fibronectin type III-like domain-containing protein n=1 Tax=Miscanthus lutarioriparius TaxID=422564 RepID=A0A811S5U9_9POAL|nr:unnamed protein product [Miscanthus lutarioriparius]